MKRYIALALAAICLVLCLAGCAREDMTIKMNKDGTGSFSMSVAIKEGYYEELKDLGVDPFKDKESFEAEYDGEKYIGVTETKEYASFEEMQKALSELEYETDFLNNDDEEEDIVFEDIESGEVVLSDGEDESDEETEDRHVFKNVEITKDGAKYVFSAVMNKLEGDAHGQKLADVVKVSVTIEMPAKITEYKGDNKPEENRIVYDISNLEEDVELYASCKVVSKVPAFIGLGIAVVAGVACIILKKKRK